MRNAHIRAWLAEKASSLSASASERAAWLERYWREVDATTHS